MKDLSPVLFEDSPSSSPCLLVPEGVCAAGGAFEVFGTSVEEAVREMRFRIEQKTKLTASAGERKATLEIKLFLLSKMVIFNFSLKLSVLLYLCLFPCVFIFCFAPSSLLFEQLLHYINSFFTQNKTAHQ